MAMPNFEKDQHAARYVHQMRPPHEKAKDDREAQPLTDCFETWLSDPNKWDFRGVDDPYEPVRLITDTRDTGAGTLVEYFVPGRVKLAEGAYFIPHAKGEPILLKHIEVRPEARQQGLFTRIRRQLLDAFDRDYPDRRVKTYFAPCVGEGTALELLDFYKSFGFVDAKDWDEHVWVRLLFQKEQFREGIIVHIRPSLYEREYDVGPRLFKALKAPTTAPLR